MNVLLGLSRAIDRFNEIVGKAMGWLILLAILDKNRPRGPSTQDAPVGAANAGS